MTHRAVHGQLHHHTTARRVRGHVVGDVGADVRERAVGLPEVRNAQTAQHLAVGQGIGREAVRDVDRDDVDAVVRERLPKRDARPKVPRDGRTDVLHLETRRRHVGEHRRSLGRLVEGPLDEVEDAVVAGRSPGGEARPGDGGLGRVGGAEVAVVASPVLLHQLRQVRQLALGSPLLEPVGVRPVESEDDETAVVGELGMGRRALAARLFVVAVAASAATGGQGNGGEDQEPAAAHRPREEGTGVHRRGT